MPFVEVADRVWVSRYPWFDLNVTVVGSASGLLVVDTHASATAARAVIEEILALGAGRVIAVVNTHEHFDHTFGNGAFRAAFGEIPVHAHEAAAANTVPAGERIQENYAELGYPGSPDDPDGRAVCETEITAADTTFSSARAIDLGDRLVELVHPGRGHTAGDVVVQVGDADVLIAGDLVEESAHSNGVPGFGPDSYPMEWPLALDIVLSLIGPDTVVIPGHGALVDRDFVEEQRNTIGIVAETIRDLAGRGVPVGDALAAGTWPYPRERLADAVRRGYEHLPRSQKRLPLL